jgi:hypothetical protein
MMVSAQPLVIARWIANAQVPMTVLNFGIDVDRSPKPPRPQSHTPVIGFVGGATQTHDSRIARDMALETLSLVQSALESASKSA